jgi:hypothetical protein
MSERRQVMESGPAFAIVVAAVLTFYPVRILLLWLLSTTWQIQLSASKHYDRVDDMARRLSRVSGGKFLLAGRNSSSLDCEVRRISCVHS